MVSLKTIKNVLFFDDQIIEDYKTLFLITLITFMNVIGKYTFHRCTHQWKV